MRKHRTAAIGCILAVMTLGASEPQPATSGDPYTGNWQTAESGLAAQVYATVGRKYRAHVFRALGTAEDPIAVLEGTRDAGGVTFSGDGWTGAIERGRFTCQKRDEKFAMRRVTQYSPTLNAPPPVNAVVLFDGTNLDQWASQKEKEWHKADGPADDWEITEEGWIESIPWAGSIITKEHFGDFRLHLEFRLLGPPTNSGVYLQARYEIDISDSYGSLEGSRCGALSNLPKPVEPRLHMAAPARAWQTFDIDFRAPRFDAGGAKAEKAQVTVIHNGVAIHDRVRLDPPRGAAKRLGEGPTGPIMLQEHGEPIQFRNIWILRKAG